MAGVKRVNNSDATGKVKQHANLKVLFIPLEYKTWANASHWAYPLGIGMEEALNAHGIQYVTIPALHEVSSHTAGSWLSYARNISKFQQFDQVWFEISHSNLDETFLDWIAGIAPIRVGFLCESLETDPREWAGNPEGTQKRLRAVEKSLAYLTHVIAADEVDVDKFNTHGPVPAMWWGGGIIPARFICEQAPPVSKNHAVFYGALYGDRKKWLDMSSLKDVLVRPEASPEYDTDLPERFDQLHYTAEQYLKSGRPFSTTLFENYINNLRDIRGQCFALWLQGLQGGCTVVNLPQYSKIQAGRIVEGIAAGRPVISWEIPGRPRTKALYEDGKEIMLYDSNNPDQLVSHIQRIRRETGYGQRIAANALKKLRSLHTSEKFVGQLLDWIENGNVNSPDDSGKTTKSDSRSGSISHPDINTITESTVTAERAQHKDNKEKPSLLNEPLVSILLPVYNSFSYSRSNGQRLLPRALDSLLSQTFQNFELLILDNQSTDETPEVCKEYAAKDPRIHYILDDRKRFPEDGVNYLAQFMRGKYYMGANDDDLWDPRYIEKTVCILEQQPDIAMAYSNGYYIDIFDKPNRPILAQKDYYGSNVSPFANFVTYIQKRNILPIAFGVYRTDSFRRMLPFEAFDQLRANVDNLFIARFFLHGYQCYCLDEHLFYYRDKHRYVDPDPNTGMPGLDKPFLIWIYYIRHQFFFLQKVFEKIDACHLSRLQKSYARCASLRGFIIHSCNLFNWVQNDIIKSEQDKQTCARMCELFNSSMPLLAADDERYWKIVETTDNEPLINRFLPQLFELLKQRIELIHKSILFYNRIGETQTPELIRHSGQLLSELAMAIEKEKKESLTTGTIQPLSQMTGNDKTHTSTLPFQRERTVNHDIHVLYKDSLAYLRSNAIWKGNKPLRLHLGCGEQYLADYVNIDFPPSQHNVMDVKADLYADITKLNFPAESVDEIRLHHVFEHFNRVTALALLIKWHHWLKIDGKLHIETPDLVGSAKTLLAEHPWRTKMGVVRHIAGDQSSRWAYHVDHWFPERFEHTLNNLGFRVVQTQTTSWPHEPFLSNVTVIAVKSQNVSLAEQLKSADELLWESTVASTEQPTYEVWKQQIRSLLSDKSEMVTSCLPQHGGSQLDQIAHIFQQSGPEQPIQELHDFNQRERDRWVRMKALTVPAGSRVLDIGAGTCPYRALFAHCDYKTHDFKRYTGEKLGGTTEYGKIDYESDICAIPVMDNSFDVIVCTEVLEHTPEPIEALREMSRILKEGGRLFLTAPLGSGLHQLPYHYYGGFTPEWYKHFCSKFGLYVSEISSNGGFFKLLAQECARIVWTLPQHQHLHGNHVDFIRDLFGEWIPRYLFEMEKKHCIDQFTVGYHVEAIKARDIDIVQKLIDNDMKNVNLYIEAAQSLLNHGNFSHARRYVEDALELNPNNSALTDIYQQLTNKS